LELVVVLGVHEVVRVPALIEKLEIVRLHRRRVDRVSGAKTMLVTRARTKVLELGLNHRAQVARRVVTELENAARIALEDDDHSAADLGCRYCHMDQTDAEDR